MTTGEKITEQRKKLGLTQQQLADGLGVTRQAVSRWESDLAFPETDTLLKMSEMFGCTVDYLLKYNAEEKSGDTEEGVKTRQYNLLSNNIFGYYFEYKSKTTIFGLPLVHVNIGFGRVAKGIFSIGLVSAGFISVGLLSLGLFSFAMLSLGLLSLGAISAGAISLGGVSLGIIVLGGVAIGCFSMGGCSIGLFAFGGFAWGKYIGVGDAAYGWLSYGLTTSAGTKLAVTPENYAATEAEAMSVIEAIPKFWRGCVNMIKPFIHALMS